MKTLAIKPFKTNEQIKYRVSIRLETIPYSYEKLAVFNSLREAKLFVDQFYKIQAVAA